MKFNSDVSAVILNVSHNNYIAGGSDRVFLETANLLREHGHRVVPFCASSAKNLTSSYADYFPQSINTDRPKAADIWRFIYSSAARSSLESLLNNVPIDLAHLHIYYGKLTASILKPLKDRNIPVVQTLHEYKLLCPVYTMVSSNEVCEACGGGSFWRALPKKCNRDSLARTMLSVSESYVSRWLGSVDDIDHFIGISDFVTHKMIQYGIPANKITTVHNFIDADNYRPLFEFGDYVLYFGRLERVKGIYSLLEAFAGLPDQKLVIAGVGAELEPVTQWIESRGLDNIDLVGFVSGEKLHDVVRGAICTVIPSEWHEPFGLTVLESFALGKPVVATRMGGIPEIIDDGEDGLLVEAGDPVALRAAIISLAGDEARVRSMGKAGRRKVEQQFSKEAHYLKLESVYSAAREAVGQGSVAVAAREK